MISIIVPIYNAQSTIQKCIKSILAQTYKNYELILVDDGSQDNSAKYCKDFVKENNNILYTRKENGGVSSARNYGIKKAKGEWITFIDADDYVSENYLSDFVYYINKKSITSLFMQNYTNNQSIPIIKEFKKLNNEEIVMWLFERKYILQCGPNAKLYNLETIKNNKIIFPEDICIGEDYIFVMRYLQCCSEVYLLPYKNYYIVDIPTSLSKNYYIFEIEFKAYNTIKELVINIYGNYGFYDKKLILENICNLCGFMLKRSLISIIKYSNDYNRIQIEEKVKRLTRFDLCVLKNTPYNGIKEFILVKCFITYELYKINTFILRHLFTNY